MYKILFYVGSLHLGSQVSDFLDEGVDIQKPSFYEVNLSLFLSHPRSLSVYYTKPSKRCGGIKIKIRDTY